MSAAKRRQGSRRRGTPVGAARGPVAPAVDAEGLPHPGVDLRGPELLTLAEVARRLDVGSRHIANLAVEGLPRVKNKQGHYRYEWGPCLKWYIAHKEAAAQRRAEPASLEDARQRKETATARLTELDLALREGHMVTIEDAERHIASFLARLRAKVVTLPTKYAHRMVGATLPEAQARLDEAVEEILGELAGTGEEVAADDEPAGVASATA